MSSFKLKTLYAVNTHTSHVVLKGGFIDVPMGGYAVIAEQDAQHSDVLYAATRGWIDVTDVKPDESTLVKPEPLMAEISGYKGMTAEELAASKAEEASAPAETGAKAEAIGTPTSPDAAEATSERIGETAETANKRTARKSTKAE